MIAGERFKATKALPEQVLLIMTGFLCNNDCVMCSVKPKGLQHEPRSTREILADIEKGKKAGYASIEFTGGEPTTRADLPLLIAYAKKNGYHHIALGTNARALSSLEFLKTLKKNGLTRVTTTIYGDCPEVHDAVTRVPGSFRQTVQGIVNVLRLGITTSVNTVVFNGTIGHLKGIGEFLSGMGVSQWTLLDLIPDGYATDAYSSFAASPRKFQKAFRDMEPALSGFTMVTFMDFPYCFFPPAFLGRSNCNFINAKGRTEIIKQVGYSPNRFRETGHVFYDIHKTRIQECASCAYCDECGGVWTPYRKLYGESCIRPIAKKLLRSAAGSGVRGGREKMG